jgi:uncharacterized membrane protein
MTRIGDLPGGSTSSFATGVPDNGETVVGHGNSELGSEAFRWTMSGGLIGLGDLTGGRLQQFSGSNLG